MGKTKTQKSLQVTDCCPGAITHGLLVSGASTSKSSPSVLREESKSMLLRSNTAKWDSLWGLFTLILGKDDLSQILLTLSPKACQPHGYN